MSDLPFIWFVGLMVSISVVVIGLWVAWERMEHDADSN